MNNRLIILISIFFACFSVFAQNWETAKNSSQYIYGEGWGATLAEADKQALNDLISKISVHVIGDVSHQETENISNSTLEHKSSFQMSVSTYSNATLNNTHKEILENEPDAHVVRWIKTTEIAKIFEGRKLKIKDYVTSAINAEKQGKIDQSLKDYYWALCLVKSLRYPNEMKFMTAENKEVLLITWLPRQINEIFSHIKAVVTKRNGDELELLITYKEKPVNSIDYTYFDGRDWSNIYSAKDGLGVLELAPGNQSENIQLKFEYEYHGQSHTDKDVESVINSLSATAMRNAYFSIKNKECSIPNFNKSDFQANSFSEISPNIYSKPIEIQNSEKYAATVFSVTNAITNKKFAEISHCFTPEGLDIFNQLIRYGNAKVVGSPQINVFQNGDEVIARGLQMSFSFKYGIRKSFVEDVVFYFNKECLIDNVTFGLGDTAENDILCKGIWEESARFAIMSFLENYKTAYALKRIDYLNSIFDDDAVIITGRVIHVPAKKLSNDVNGTQFAHDIIKYNRQTKHEYIYNLKRSFASKEFINLRFADNDVRKLGKGGEMFAIQISQEYYSSNYGDKGYLFLMVDLNNPDKPIIKVRTWQPEKDPEFGIYGPEHFK
ncbi:MAG: LPP20 family lipoprotein [Muribaculaceae bacterium]|nr:LPP20 family lipoprotein [Muribaculaceae bacterium]